MPIPSGLHPSPLATATAKDLGNALDKGLSRAESIRAASDAFVVWIESVLP